MTKLDHVKTAAKLIVGFSVSYAVGNAINNNTDTSTPLKKTEVIIASFVIGNLVAEHAEKHVTKMIDSAKASWNEHVAKN